MKRCCHHNLQEQISFLSLLLHTSFAFVKPETHLMIFRKMYLSIPMKMCSAENKMGCLISKKVILFEKVGLLSSTETADKIKQRN